MAVCKYLVCGQTIAHVEGTEPDSLVWYAESDGSFACPGNEQTHAPRVLVTVQDVDGQPVADCECGMLTRYVVGGRLYSCRACLADAIDSELAAQS